MRNKIQYCGTLFQIQLKKESKKCFKFYQMKRKLQIKSYNGNDELTYKEMETIKVCHGEV